jgi:hypothetical protein
MMVAPPARASDPCAERMTAAIAVIEAKKLEIADWKKIHTKDEQLAAKLTAQRDDAFETAKQKADPLVPHEFVVIGAFLAGLIIGKVISK